MARLLIVEDDNDIRELLGEVLETIGHAVQHARNGVEGLEQLRQDPPDVILLDVEMPGLDGPGMLRHLRAEGAGWERIPVVLLSGSVDLTVVAQREGTPYFLEKPTEVGTLTATVELALRERRAPRPQGWRG